MNKAYETLLNDRDIISTQLVKKNNELAHRDEKIKLLQITLDKREKDYEQRVDDIRLLKLEIQKLRHEKGLLCKGIENMTDLRQEIFILERELNHERIRARALEELIKTPQNIHRWRKLEDTDPSTLELIEQVRMLQKLSLDKTQKMKELKAICNSKSDTTHIETDKNLKEEMLKFKKRLMLKDEKIKGLIAELKMREAQIIQYKQDIPIRRKSFKESDYNRLPKGYKDERFCESAPVRLKSSSKFLPKSSSDVSRKFLGGGFNLTPKKESS